MLTLNGVGISELLSRGRLSATRHVRTARAGRLECRPTVELYAILAGLDMWKRLGREQGVHFGELKSAPALANRYINGLTVKSGKPGLTTRNETAAQSGFACTEWLHMRALKRHKTEFWGQEYTVRPMLLDAVFGDGKEFVWFEYMDDRPYYYVARVPSGTRKEKGYPDVIEDIEEAIRDEAMDFYSDRAWREHDRKGYVSTNRRWPIPPDMASGSSWGAYEPPKHVLAMCNDRTEQRQ